MSQPPDSGVGPQPAPHGPWWRQWRREWRREEITLTLALVASLIAIVISLVTAGSVSRHARADVHRLDNELRSLRGSLQGLTRADVQRLDDELSSLRQSLQGVTGADVHQLQNELGALRESSQGLAAAADVRRLDQDLHSLRESFQGVTGADVQRLDNDLRSLRGSLQGLTRTDVQRLDGNLRTLRESLQGLTRADFQGLERQLASVRESLQKVEAENKGRVEELDHRIGSTEERIVPFQNEIQKLKGQAANASNDLADAKNCYEQTIQAMQDFRITFRNLDAVLVGKEAELNVLVRNLERDAGNLILEQMPIGSIVMWPLTEKPPAKWRICNGEPVSPQEAPEFWELFKNSHWTTDEGKAVSVPDLRGYFVRGADTRKEEDPKKVDEEAPREVGSKQLAKVPQHAHDVSDLRVAGGIWQQQDRNVLLYQSQRKEQLKAGDDLRALRGGGGAWDPSQLQGLGTEVDAMAVRGELGQMVKEQGKVRPDNVALHFIIRVQR